MGEATLPIYEDLNGHAGREKFGMDDFSVEFSVYPFRISEGEDASCLNLNRAQRPRLMATDEARLAELRPAVFFILEVSGSLSVFNRMMKRVLRSAGYSATLICDGTSATSNRSSSPAPSFHRASFRPLP